MGPDVAWMICAWTRAILAALAGLLLGRYAWSVACCYATLCTPDNATHATDVCRDTSPPSPVDARLLGQALRDGLRHSVARTPGNTSTWLIWLPAAILALLYALLAAYAKPPISACGLAWAITLLLLLALIDARTQLLPDALTLPLLWMGLALALIDAGLVRIHAALTATMIAYAALWLLAWCFLHLRGHDGMGAGDVKLLAAIGAWVGWPDVFLVLLCASVTGLIHALAVARARHLHGQHPFGPHLAGAAIVVLLWRILGSSG